MNSSRRDFLKGTGALVVSFRAASVFSMQAGDGQFGTHASHIDAEELDSWLAIHADGSVTAFTGKCDFGQGIYTAQTQLVAEELCVALERVKLVQCDTAVTPDQGSTSGSQSTPTNFNHQNLALAAATAREALLKLAAQRFGESVESLKAENGVVTGASGRQVKYEDLIGGKHFNLTLDRAATQRPQSEWTVLGKSVPSLDRTALMTGQFEFVHHVRVAGMLHGRVVRPPAIGSTLISVDQTSVKDVPSLVKVVVRKNFVGVVAETQHSAVQAARKLKVEWKPGPKLPPQASFFDSLKEQPSRDALELDSNDVTLGLTAKHFVRARYTYPFQAHGSLGASCAVADVKADSATVWSATQSIYPTRNCVAMLLGMPADKVRVIYTRGSGCYGLNGADAVSFEAAVMSQDVGRPVRLQFSRQDEMGWENYGNACLIEQRAALDDSGRITVWDRESWIPNMGSRPGYDRPGNVISGMLLGYEPPPLKPGKAAEPSGELRNGSNTVPEYMAGCIQDKCQGNGVVRAARVLTHTVRSPFFTGPLRSPLRIQNTFANECFVDELCLHAGADPVEFRLKHLQQPRLVAVLKAVATAAKWQKRVMPRKKTLANGLAHGQGIACVAYEGRNGYAALVADVAVDLTSGLVQPRQFVIAIDCGPISNPDGLRNQVEGGLLQGTSRSLVEEVTWDEQRVTSTDWESYQSLRLDYEIPEIEIVFVTPEGVAATGAGETSITVTPAAIANAIFDATGARIRDVPFTPSRIKAALATRSEGAIA